VNIRFGEARQGQAGDFDILSARLFDGFGRAGNSGGCDSHYDADHRIDLEDSLGFGEGLVAVIIARADYRKLDAGVLFGKALLDEFDPLVLVGRAERPGNDGELAFTAQNALRP
jgi:hypothetical protein